MLKEPRKLCCGDCDFQSTNVEEFFNHMLQSKHGGFGNLDFDSNILVKEIQDAFKFLQEAENPTKHPNVKPVKVNDD